MLLPDPAGGSSLLVSPVLARLPRLRHGFSTRALGDASGSPPGGVAVSRALGDALPAWTLHGLRQVHGSRVVDASPASAGEQPPAADALVSAGRGDLLVVRTADCVAVLLAAVGSGGVEAVAAAHAGWRGLVSGILPATARRLREVAPGARLVAALGPAIGPCCYEVGPDVAGALAAAGGAGCLRPGPGDRALADLPAAATAQLRECQVAVPDPSPPPCTRCHPDLFPSFRRDGETAPRMAAFMGMEPA